MKFSQALLTIAAFCGGTLVVAPMMRGAPRPLESFDHIVSLDTASSARGHATIALALDTDAQGAIEHVEYRGLTPVQTAEATNIYAFFAEQLDVDSNTPAESRRINAHNLSAIEAWMYANNNIFMNERAYVELLVDARMASYHGEAQIEEPDAPFMPLRPRIDW